MGWRLLVLFLLAHGLLATEEENGSDLGSADGSDMGNADGSDMGSADGSDEGCIEPVPRPGLLGGTVATAGDLEPRCHLACIERIALEEGINMEEELVSTTYPAWPMIPNSALERNCSIYKMVESCRECCSLLTKSQCERRYENEQCDSPDPNTCQICSQRHCKTGCDLSKELDKILNDTHVPPNPVAPLELIIADGADDSDPTTSDAGLYTINPSNSVPIETDTDQVRYPTIIIIRVGRVGAKKQKYIWMTSFEETLNLTAYACQEARVQLGAINKFGEAETNYAFHTSLTIDVYGESPPTHTSHPDIVSIETSPDVRPGYWKHAIVTIHWKRAIKGFELLDHYNAEFRLATPDEQPYCKPRILTKRVNKTCEDDVKWIISLENLGDGPVSDCHYIVKVESVSVDRSVPTYPPQIHHKHITREIHVGPPTNIRVTDQDADRRPGFFGHAVLTISWSQPEGFTGFHYYITTVQRLISHTESKQCITSSPITSTNWTVSDSEETRVLLLGHNIRITVCTRLWGSKNTDECVNSGVITLKTVNSFNPLTLTCSKPQWDGSRYSVTLHWTVPQFVAYGDGIFGSFAIEGEEGITKRYLDTVNVEKRANETSYSYKWMNLKPLESERHYEFEVTIQWLNSDLYQKPSNVPKRCQVSAEPPPPSPVQNVSLSHLTFSEGEIQFVFQWAPPATANGELTHYLACLGGRLLAQREESPETLTDGNDTTCLIIRDVDLYQSGGHYVWKKMAPRPSCIYFQIRAHTELGGGGNWSTPVIISNGAISSGDTCNEEPTETPEVEKSTDESVMERQKNSSSTVQLGAVVAVVGLLLLALLM